MGIFFAIFYCYRSEKEKNDNFYEKLQDGFDVSILIVGDSISEGAGVSDPEHFWGNMLKEYIEDNYHVNVLVNNISLGGNISYAGYVRTNYLQDGDIYDLAIVCFAENDDVNDFDLYYEALLRAINKKCPHASLMTILESSQQEYTEKIKIIQNLSSYYSATVIDTIEAYNNSDMTNQELSEDGVHPSDQGQKLYFESIINGIKKNMDAISGKNKSDSMVENVNISSNIAKNPLVSRFDDFEYYNKDSMNITSKGYEFKLTEEDITLGIDYTYMPDITGQLEIYVDGLLYYETAISWNYEFSQRHIWIALDNYSVDNSIEIRFSDDAMKESFNGIAINSINLLVND